jgi:L-tartrate/succinate antiporter
MKRSVVQGVAPVAVAVGLALLPAPAGLSDAAWRFFALFAGTVTALVLEPIPAAATGLIAVSVAAAFRLVEPTAAGSARWALSGFANTTVWLIFAAFVLALGYERSGLGRRLALVMVRAIGRRPLGLGYAVALSDVLLAPVTPSNTARSAGTLFPVIRQIPLHCAPGSPDAQRRMGGYLAWTAFAVTCVTSSMFLTALAPNLLAVEVVRSTVGVHLEWTSWTAGFWPVGLALVAATPLATYAVFRPGGGREAEGAAGWASAQLEAMGGFSRREATMAVLALLALAGWVAGRDVLDATTVALMVVCLMLLSGVVEWEDILGHSAAWNVLVWFATLVALADGLARVGFVAWVARSATAPLAGLPPLGAALLLLALFFAVHYLFASITAHVAAVLPVVLATAAASAGIDVGRFAAVLCYRLGLMGGISPDATGPAPVYYGSGFLSRRQFWGLGLAFGFVFLLALLVLAAAVL